MRWKNFSKRIYKRQVKNITCHDHVESRNDLLLGILQKAILIFRYIFVFRYVFVCSAFAMHSVAAFSLYDFAALSLYSLSPSSSPLVTRQICIAR